MRRKAWKKHPAWLLYVKKDLCSVSLFHATAIQEAENIRKLGLRQPIAFIPNGVDLPSLIIPHLVKSQQRTLLFLSRIHPTKGLLGLVNAWHRVRPTGWRVVVAGPNEDNHQQVVEKAIRRAGLEKDFAFVGLVEGTAKEQLYLQADLFVLPSFSENFGIVVAEALAYGVPVITTKGTPWQDLITYRCGWWIEVGAEPLAAALREAVCLDDRERQAMGLRGRQYVQRFSWPQLAEQMLATYRWMVYGDVKPDCVMVD